MRRLRENKAITLIALVITIIVLLILAGITIGQLQNSGLFNNTQTAKQEYANAQEKEDTKIQEMNNEIEYYIDGEENKEVASTRENNKLIYRASKTNDVTIFEYSNDNEGKKFKAKEDAYYQIECWGASGKQNKYNKYTTNGAYTKGVIKLSKDEEIFVFVGQQGTGVKDGVAFNGGGACTSPYSDNNNAWGGGATDIRLVNGDWDDFESLKSRIMVAAGGCSQMERSNGTPLSYAGKLTSDGIANENIPGATQTSGFKFGIGQSGGRNGGGGGYYGGYGNDRCATRRFFIHIRISGM